MLNKLWIILIITISILGLYFNKKIKYKNYKIQNLLKNINKESLYLSLGTKMGVGTIIGTTMSILIGGPSTIIWIYIFTILTSSLVYVESYLGNKYKQRIKNSYVGGIYYYTKYGLNNNILALISLVLFVSTYSFFFLMIQTNTVKCLLKINKFFLLLITIILLTITVSKDTIKIRNIINKIVPIMTTFFISISIYAIYKKINVLPIIIKDIFTNLFNYKSITIGLIIGIKRSIFLNELLIGTTSMSSAVNDKDINSTTNSLVLSSYFINFIISTLIALLVMIYMKENMVINNDYIGLLINVFAYHYSFLGKPFLLLIIILLSTSTIISGTYIGISNITYLTNNKLIVNSFKLIMIIFISLGIILNTNKVWNIVDLFMLLLITLNIYIIIKLRSKIID